ncbi:hypothetical protein MJA45_03585 [Paenibacillus aurantius]|uniref:Alpha/beta hydrolase n=1 Tax=Paenibacillus aurantius TaxID=2918900 RepID=A0AA96LFA1_9BACL|nr:hypothetical protein [Paenibacillus aurantius]WNQ12143.1 hypothetical protein MJA45_03585 [Paenibacillus aurantius]
METEETAAETNTGRKAGEAGKAGGSLCDSGAVSTGSIPSAASEGNVGAEKTGDAVRTAEKAVSVYFLSGIGTWESGRMFAGAMRDIMERYRSEGYAFVHVRDLYPYGSMDGVHSKRFYRHLAKQALKVSRDMYVRYERNIGGRLAYEKIKADYDQYGSGDIILIGHSGGGIAAYNTAQLLSDDGYRVARVILVGAPEQWIHKDWHNRVHALRKAGRIGDWVTWLGKPCFGAPKVSDEVNIVGGHTDYFRWDKVDDNGVSNLQKVMDRIWQWLRPRDLSSS